MIQLLKALAALVCILLPIFACKPAPLPPVDHGELTLDTSFAFQRSTLSGRDWGGGEPHTWTVKVQRGHRYEITLTPLIPPIESLYSQIVLSAWTIDYCEDCRFDVKGDIRDSLTLTFIPKRDQIMIQTYVLPDIPCFIEVREVSL